MASGAHRSSRRRERVRADRVGAASSCASARASSASTSPASRFLLALCSRPWRVAICARRAPRMAITDRRIPTAPSPLTLATPSSVNDGPDLRALVSSRLAPTQLVSCWTEGSATSAACGHLVAFVAVSLCRRGVMALKKSIPMSATALAPVGPARRRSFKTEAVAASTGLLVSTRPRHRLSSKHSSAFWKTPGSAATRFARPLARRASQRGADCRFLLGVYSQSIATCGTTMSAVS